MFEHLKTNADHLAADAAWLRRERDTHARQGFDILRRRVGSPPGLVVCFGAGVFAGARSRNREIDPADKARRESHLVERLLHGPVGAAAIKLGTAFLAGALLHPDREPPPPPL